MGLARLRELPELRDRAPVYADRAAAGRALARLLESYRAGDATVLAIPAGAVADAYERWYDMSENEVEAILTASAARA